MLIDDEATEKQLDEDIKNIIGFKDVYSQIKDSLQPSGGSNLRDNMIAGSGDLVGIALAIYSDINEYGFIWDRDPHTEPRTGTGQFILVNADTSEPKRAYEIVINGWKDSMVPGASALPVPIPRPAEIWRWSKTDFCDAAGSLNSPISNGPYTGPGAVHGQLLYKFGPDGKALPIYNEGYAKGINDTGNLFIGSNIPQGSGDKTNFIKVYIGMVLPEGKPLFINIALEDTWFDAGISRRLNWDKSHSIYYGDTNPTPVLMALEAPAVAQIAGGNFNGVDFDYGPGATTRNAAGIPKAYMNIEGKNEYPYTGPGARYGQLIYKWGENGTVLPVWHSEETGYPRTGDLFLCMNDNDMSDNDDFIYALATP